MNHTSGAPIIADDIFAHNDSLDFSDIGASVTGSADRSITQLVNDCEDYCRDIDIDLVRAAAKVALRLNGEIRRGGNVVRSFLTGRPKDLWTSRKDMKAYFLNSRTHNFISAASVARLNLDGRTESKAEAVIAALFQNILAFRPDLRDRIEGEVWAAYRKSRGDSADYQQFAGAMSEALELAGDASLMTAMPSLKNVMKLKPEKQNEYFSRNLAMMLRTPHVRVFPIKIAEMVRRLSALDQIADKRIRDEMLLYAEKLYIPMAEYIGWYDAVGAIKDSLLKYRDPSAYERTEQEMEVLFNPTGDQYSGKLFGKGGAKMIAAGERRILEALEGNVWSTHKGQRFAPQVSGRVKRVAAAYGKIQERRNPLHPKYKPDYGAADLDDGTAYRVVVGDADNASDLTHTGDIRDCWKTLKALKESGLKIVDITDYIHADAPYVGVDDWGCPVQKRRSPNGYQALHAVLVDGKGRKFEVQIRSWAMHRLAEYGLASHVQYKIPGQVTSEQDRARMQSVRERLWGHGNGTGDLPTVVDTGISVVDHRGEIYDLPADSRVVDFLAVAYGNKPLPKYVTVNRGRRQRLDHVLLCRPLRNCTQIQVKGAMKFVPPSWAKCARTPEGTSYITRAIMNPQHRRTRRFLGMPSP